MSIRDKWILHVVLHHFFSARLGLCGDSNVLATFFALSFVIFLCCWIDGLSWRLDGCCYTLLSIFLWCCCSPRCLSLLFLPTFVFFFIFCFVSVSSPLLLFLLTFAHSTTSLDWNSRSLFFLDHGSNSITHPAGDSKRINSRACRIGG